MGSHHSCLRRPHSMAPFWCTSAVFILLTFPFCSRLPIPGRPLPAGVNESATPCSLLRRGTGSVQDAPVSEAGSGESHEVSEVDAGRAEARAEAIVFGLPRSTSAGADLCES